MGEKTVTIKKGDLVDAIIDLMKENKYISELVSKNATFFLLLPCIAVELEEQLGLLEEKESEVK